MTTWTRDQITAVRGHRATAVLDPVVVDRSDGVAVDVARAKLARQIIDACHAHAVDAHAEDMEYRVEPDPYGVRIIARWNPGTREVVFVGGPADGQVYVLEGAPFMPMQVAVEPPLPAYAAEASDRILPTPQTVVYTCTGWHEQDRRWVYGVR